MRLNEVTYNSLNCNNFSMHSTGGIRLHSAGSDDCGGGVDAPCGVYVVYMRVRGVRSDVSCLSSPSSCLSSPSSRPVPSGSCLPLFDRSIVIVNPLGPAGSSQDRVSFSHASSGAVCAPVFVSLAFRPFPSPSPFLFPFPSPFPPVSVSVCSSPSSSPRSSLSQSCKPRSESCYPRVSLTRVPHSLCLSCHGQNALDGRGPENFDDGAYCKAFDDNDK